MLVKWRKLRSLKDSLHNEFFAGAPGSINIQIVGLFLESIQFESNVFSSYYYSSYTVSSFQ